MPQELDAIARTRNAQMLTAALPAVEAEIQAELIRVDNAIVGAVRAKRLTPEDAIALCHQKAALTLLMSRLTRTSATHDPASKAIILPEGDD